MTKEEKKQYDRIRYQAQREKLLNQAKTYQRENISKVKEYQKQWYRDNKETVRARHAKHYRLNKENHNLQMKIWYETNRIEVSAKQRERYRANCVLGIKKQHIRTPEQNFKYNHRRKARVTEAQIGTVSAEDIREILQENGGLCVYCDKAEANTIDHIIPISRGGPHALFNLCGACKSCNSSKGNKLLEEWIKCG